MNSPIGSLWRKWDLHVHTPKSIYQNYGSDNDVTWEKYIRELESLNDKDFGVLGINDYLFLDGYKKLLQEQASNSKLAKLKLLPVVEFRIEKFAGIQFENLKRINLHVIFSDEISVETIQSQFLNTLEQSYTIDDGREWTRAITPESVAELGRELKASVPPSELSKYGTDLDEGFNNLNIKDDQIFKSLDKDCFKGKYLIAIGKTEWDELKWSDASIATKKSIINKADIVFTASESIQNFNNAKEKLKTNGVKDLLLDCSDAHYFSDSQNKDRIGNCNTWIKADPTFKGLTQILIEPEERIFVGEKPPSIIRVESNPTKYIKELNIQKLDNSPIEEIWFDGMPPIPINIGLVAIIGNKGNGKSAIADIFGLAGNTRNYEKFSFLNDKKFRQKRPNRAEWFQANILWADNLRDSSVILSNNPNYALPEKVKYIPQSYLETLCTETDEKKFSEELKKVIFSHVDESERLGKTSIDELIEYKSEEINRFIQNLKNDLSEINSKLSDLEKRGTSEHRAQIDSLLKLKNDEYEAHKKNKPIEVPEPIKSDTVQKEHEAINAELLKIKLEKDGIEKNILGKREERKSLTLKATKLQKFQQSISNFKEQYNQLKEQYQQDLSVYGIDINDIISLSITDNSLITAINDTAASIKTINDLLDEDIEESLTAKLKTKNEKIQELQGKLDEPSRKYQQYKDNLKVWEEKEKEIVGSGDKQNTIVFYQKVLDYLDNQISKDIEAFNAKRIEKVKSIYTEKNKIVELYKELYRPVTRFISIYGELMKDYIINLDVSIQLKDFNNKFFNYVSRGAKGSFIGTDEGEIALNQLSEGVNFNSEEETISFINAIIERLQSDFRTDKKEERKIEEQLRQGYEVKDLYDFLCNLDFLEPNYKLKLGNKNISELSPGERGALLLIFYLLLDKQETPLIIDQPEENLDNQSVYGLLVKFIKEAKKKRQIIIVTHNPNLAVVCDAEQIISVKIEKENKNKVSYISGAIENPIINQEIVRILEGTFPAFDNRTEKYKVSKN